MSDRPWLQDADPSLRDERMLLQRLNAQQPPAGSVDHGWTALSAALPGLKAAATTSAAASAGYGLVAKIAVGVVAAGAALWGGSRWLERGASEHSVRPSASSSAPAALPAIEAPVATPQETEQPPVALKPADRLPSPAARSSVSTTLGEEGRLVSKAHQLIQSGQGAEALKVLRTLESRYPRSVLSQEREVLTIEALGATGDSGAARARAKRFLDRHPKTPHAARLQRFVE